MNRKLVSLIIISLVVGIVVGFTIGFTAKIRTFFVDYGALQNEYTLLEDDYATLNDTHTALVSQYSSLHTEYIQLKQNYTTLNNENTQLEENYTRLKQHSFTYYTVGDALNISSLKIEGEDGIWGYTTISGNITNISNNPIEKVYVYVLIRNPDGTMFFSYYDSYERIVDLYIGETASFEIGLSSYEEGQTVEIWLVF